jgi:uncharacterized protein YdaU (DUF1376 family)
MARNAWFPFYPGDFLADTEHLNALETGAYVRLILHYYQRKHVPKTDAAIAAIMHIDRRTWMRIKPTIAEFFEMPDWRHKRIDHELEKIAAIKHKRTVAGRKGWLMSHGRNNTERNIAANLKPRQMPGNGRDHLARQTGGQPQPHSNTTLSSEISEGQQETWFSDASPELTDNLRKKGWTE